MTGIVSLIHGAGGMASCAVEELAMLDCWCRRRWRRSCDGLLVSAEMVAELCWTAVGWAWVHWAGWLWWAGGGAGLC
jgi:hypothetical protein